MSAVSFTKTMSIDELRVAIPLLGETNTLIIQSEPGCGKTSLLSMMAEDNGDKWRKPEDYFPDDKFVYIYVDCPVKDMSDVGMAIPNHESRTLEYYVADLFKMDDPRPKYILLDEFAKSPKLMQVIYTRLMLERYVGDRSLTKGSKVFGTSNNASDGVGDSMLAHAGNRVTIVEMGKPKAPAWLTWAGAKGLSTVIRGFVGMYPRVLKSYRDGDQEDNPYIFHPKKHALSFASPRSLEKADNIIRLRDKMSENSVECLLAGTIGVAASKDLSVFLSLEKSLPDVRKDIIPNPTKVDVPEQVAAQMMVMFQAIDVIESQDDLSAFMQFVNRIKLNEVQTVFFSMAMRDAKIRTLARRNQEITDWCKENHEFV